MEDGIERKILLEMAERLVAKKSEILKFLQETGNINQEVIKSVTKALLERGLLTPVYSSETTYAITQKGLKEAFRI